ncbi:MAG TPA: hypothetical protein DDX40_04325 [Rikenellaceae bacterium]|mgnify:FL=1|nr:hypothetical protein [Rikenellaceae bacterium]
MFDHINISGFRGIKETQIDGLKQVNLFFGKNNCGKSSLLDAIFLISGLSNPKLPFNINILRDYRRLGKSDINLDFYNLDTNVPITITANNDESRKLKIRLLEVSDQEVDLLGSGNNVSSSQSDSKYGLVLDYNIDGVTHRSSIVFTSSGDNEIKQEVRLDKEYEEKLNCRYLNSKFDFYASISGLVNILKNKDEHFLIDSLRFIEPRLVDFVLSENEVLVDIGLDQRIPINMMGDGARKMLAILTSIYECENGIVLLDEISNGFHYSVMKDMWLAIFKSAIKNNVQVFATTHDKDSIKGMRDAALSLNGHGADLVASYKLQKKQDGILNAYHYSLDSLDFSINQEIEVR